MRIFTFDENNNKWVEYNYEDFRRFFDDVVQKECAFKFAECTEDKIDDFLDKIEDTSTCLDDCDYYRFSACRRDMDTIEDIYIFYDLILYTLNEIIALRQRQLNYYKELKEKI